MKTKEKSTVLKEEAETLNRKLAELTSEELERVTSGNAGSAADTDFKTQFKMDESEKQYEYNLYTDGTKESAMEKFFNK